MELAAQKAFVAYGLEVQKLGLAQKGYRNTSYRADLADDTSVNLVIYKFEPHIVDRIKRLHDVSKYAATSCLPVRVPIDNRIIQISDSTRIRYAAIYSYLPGATIAWEGYTKHHIKLLGAAMGRLHTALHNYAGTPLPKVSDEQISINNRMQSYFIEPGVVAAMKQKLKLDPPIQKLLEYFTDVLHGCDKLPNQQPLHMDLVRGNILFDASSQVYKLSDGPVAVSGIIDFEKAAYGHPVFDLARTYAFLLVDCKYKTEEKIYKYFFTSGYQKRGNHTLTHITYRNKDLLQELTSFFLLHDFYKFLRHNPYEFLEQNEHYVRTRDILINRGLLKAL